MFRPLKPYQLIVDVVVAGLFTVAALPLEVMVGRAVDHNALSSAVVCIGMGAALALRRLSPTLALALAWVAAIAQMSFARPPSVTDVTIFAVLYATAAYGTRPVFWAGFASAIVGAAVITVYLFAQSLFSPDLSASTVTTAVAVLIAASFALLLSWTVGALVRTAVRARTNRVGQMRAEAAAVAEAERVRIARDMHDVVAHSLAVVIAQADGARYAAASDPSVATDALGTIATTARAALADVRLLLTQLRHNQSDGPQPTLADLEELYAQVRAAGVALRIDVDPAPPGEPPAAVQLAVFRILQEALTNALRHGDGGPVSVSLAWRPDRVDLDVRNGVAAGHGSAGHGAAPHGAAPHGAAGHGAAGHGTIGHGLIGMTERASLVGGTLTAGEAAGAFVVSARLPVGAGR